LFGPAPPVYDPGGPVLWPTTWPMVWTPTTRRPRRSVSAPSCWSCPPFLARARELSGPGWHAALDWYVVGLSLIVAE
jgi:hypothetical protein